MLSCVILIPQSFLVFPVFQPFLKRLSCFGQDGGNSDLLNKVRDIINFVALYYEKDVQVGMPLHVYRNEKF